MLKETSYSEKFQTLKKWMPNIMESIKKDVKNEHLKKDWQFAKKYFTGVNLNKVTKEELSSGYLAAIEQEEKREEIAEFISNCWLLKNGDVYHYFEEELKRINPNFNEIESINADQSEKILKGSIEQFGAYKSYLFSVLNSVAFSQQHLENLKQLAENENVKEEQETLQNRENKSVEEMKKAYELIISRMSDKYEKKLSGLQKKYLQDTEAFKKQIATLQSKLSKG